MPDLPKMSTKAYDQALRRIEVYRRKGDAGASLDLSRLGLNQVPPEIGELTALTSINLQGNQLTSFPPEICQFTALTWLDLFDNKITNLPPEIGNLAELTTLNLQSNKLVDLPPEIGNLTALTSLNLHGNQVTTLPPEISKLVNLDHLYLGQNRLTTLPSEIGKLLALTTLYIFRNQLGGLPSEIGNLIRLKVLSAGNNQLRSLPPEIGALMSLRRLILEENDLHRLPESMKDLAALKELYLHGNPALGLLPETLGPSFVEVMNRTAEPAPPKKVLNYYFRIHNLGEALNEFKLILVGRGEVGKTTLVEKLVTDQFCKFERTPGVKITQWPMKIGRAAVRAHVWDFGGQEIMHGTHRFFMTERAVYLVLVSKRTGTEDHDADYWLSLIRSFAGNEAPVILLLHRWQEQRFELNREQLTQKYGPHLCFLETDCGEKPKDEKNIKQLRQVVAKEAAKLPGLKAKWPSAWRSVKRDLPNQKKNWLTFGDFQKFCVDHAVAKAEDQEALAQCLHDLGLMLAYRSEPALRGFGVLNSMWVTDGIYQLINSALLQDAHGRFKPADFKKVLLEKDYPEVLHPYLLALMQKFRLCFPLNEAGSEYLIPELLSKEEPKFDNEFPAETSLCFTYRYERVLPEGLLPRFIVETYVQREAEHAWRTGVVLQMAGCRALVRGDLQARKITVRVVGPDSAGRRKLLAVTREHFEQIHRSFTALPVMECVPVPGHPDVELDYLDLLQFEADGVKTMPKRVDKKTLTLEVTRLLDGVDVEGVPRHQKAWKEVYCQPLHVFISYSHKDAGSMEQLRNALIPLERTKEITVWADPQIEAGQEWRDEIFGNLDRADIFILLLSQSSVASDFVMEKELPRAMEPRANGPCEIMGVVIKPCTQGLSRLKLSDQQVIFYKSKAISQTNQRDAAWDHVVGELDKVIKRLRKQRGK